MKKIQEIVRPISSIILGALLLLFYMNWLASKGASLAIGIVAVVFSVYYLTVGILSVVIGDKFSKGARLVFDILNVSLFAALFFTIVLITTISIAEYMGPTAWTINILSMIAAISVIVFYILAKVIDQPIFTRLGFLFAAIFVLALLLNILFDGVGNGIVLGNVSLIVLAIYGIYAEILLTSISKKEE